MYKKIQLKASLNKIAANDRSSYDDWIGATGTGLAVILSIAGLIWERHNTCAKALKRLLEEEGITLKDLAYLIEIFNQYMCNRQSGTPREVQREDARKFKKFFEKLIKLRQCKGEAAVLAIKAALGDKLTAEGEKRLKDLIDQYNVTGAAAALAAALAMISDLIDTGTACAQITCAKLVGLMGMLRIKFADLYEIEEDILSSIAAIALAIVALKLAIVAAPTAAVAAALTAVLATYQTALAQELESAGIPSDQIERVTKEILEAAENVDCSGAAPEEETTVEEAPNEKPTEDSKPPASGSKSCCGKITSMD